MRAALVLAALLAGRDDFLVQHGYVQVIADVRGTGGSARSSR
jgi:predicted acyl esterase